MVPIIIPRRAFPSLVHEYHRDKSPIRHLFKKHKELDKELSRLAIMVSTENDATTPTDPLSTGTVNNAAVDSVQTAQEVTTVVSIRRDGETVNTKEAEADISDAVTAEASRNGGGDGDDNGNGRYDRGRDLMMAVDISSVEGMSPLAPLSPEQPVKTSDLGGIVRSAANDDIHPVVGGASREDAPEGNGEEGGGGSGSRSAIDGVGGRNVSLVDDGRRSSRASFSRSGDEQPNDDENEPTSPGDDYDQYSGKGVSANSAADETKPKINQQEEGSFDEGSLYSVPPGQIVHGNIGDIEPTISPIAKQKTIDSGTPPLITTYDNEIHSTPGASATGLPSARSADWVGEQENDQGNNVVMSAQEARVRRMRTRFIQMKSLLSDDDDIGSPRVGDGADDAEISEDIVQTGEYVA